MSGSQGGQCSQLTPVLCLFLPRFLTLCSQHHYLLSQLQLQMEQNLCVVKPETALADVLCPVYRLSGTAVGCSVEQSD
jgi:hypothetical protein